MKKFFQTVSIIAIICVMLGNNVSAVQLENGKATIDAFSGKVTKPFVIEEIDGIKYIVGAAKGMVEYEIDVLEDGEYVLWGKACGLDINKDSFFILIDKMPKIIWDVKISKDKKTSWLKIKGRKNLKDGKIKLKKGKHKLIIRGREPKIRLEKIFIGKTGMKPQK